MLTVQLILGFVFAFANSRFSHDTARIKQDNIWITSRIITVASSIVKSINRTEMCYCEAYNLPTNKSLFNYHYAAKK